MCTDGAEALCDPWSSEGRQEPFVESRNSSMNSLAYVALGAGPDLARSCSLKQGRVASSVECTYSSCFNTILPKTAATPGPVSGPSGVGGLSLSEARIRLRGRDLHQAAYRIEPAG